MQRLLQSILRGPLTWVIPLFFTIACFAGDDAVACRQYAAACLPTITLAASCARQMTN